MPRFEETEQKITAHSDKTGPLEWWGNNFVNPFINSLVVEPANAVALAFEHATGQKQAHRLAPLPVPNANEQPEDCKIVCQGVASGLGSVLPYVLAARLSGNTMRFVGAGMKAEGVLAKLAQSEKTAQIVGGGIYDSMKETRDGESHLRNGLAGALNFGILEYWRYGAKKRVVDQLCNRLFAGAVGAVSHAAVARPELLTQNSQGGTLGRQILAGALMNALLPGTQAGIRALQDRATVKFGWGMPIDRFMKTNGEFESNNFAGGGESALIEKNLWARIEPRAKANAYFPARDIVSLKDGSSKSTFLHELQHRKEALTGVTEPGFVRAANLLEKDPEQAWNVYKAVRQAQEIRAEIASRHDEISSKAEVVRELKRTLPYASVTGDFPYFNLWCAEFNEFARSQGKYRPDADYSGYTFDRELLGEANKLQYRLSASEPKAEYAISYVMDRPDLKPAQVTKIFKHINEFLDPRQVQMVTLPYAKLAMQTLKASAVPERVKQGYIPTCSTAALEYYTFVKHPENAANLISQVVRNRKYDCADGKSIIVDGLNIIPELHWDRPYSDQLFQTTAVNVHWQRATKIQSWLLPNNSVNDSLLPGSARYERVTTNSAAKYPYLLLDVSKSPARPLQYRFSEKHRDDPSNPIMNQAALTDIGDQINGAVAGGIHLPRDLHNYDEVQQFLTERQERGTLPVIATVDCRHSLFGGAEQQTPAWHSVVINSFDKDLNLVSLFNPWGRVMHGVYLPRFFEAHRGIVPSTKSKN